MYTGLGQFIAALEATGQLHRISSEVSPILEVTEIADRHSKAEAAIVSEFARAFDPDHCDRGGKALLFENIAGCDFPLAINVFGSYRRTEMALGCEQSGGFESVAQRIGSLAKPQPPRSLGEAIAKAREFLPLLKIAPKLKRAGPCQQVVKLTERGEVDLTRLPLIKCWPLDGDPQAVGYDMTPQQAGTAAGKGRYITFAGIHTIHADDRDDAKPASHNIGMYRAQLIDETHLAMHWHIHHDGAAHWRSWKKLGQPMPIAIALGGEAVLPYAATAPLPPGISELLMAGFLNGRGIPMVRCKTVPLRVPANSEIVIEGWVSTECGEIGWAPPANLDMLGGNARPMPDGAIDAQTDEPAPGPVPPDPEPGPGAVFEGPFGDHTGFYSLPDRYPIVDVTAITHRDDAVYPTTIVGLPPQEDYYLGKATERVFLPLLQTLIPDIVDYHLPMFGCFHNCVFVRIRKAYALQARRVMHAIWGAGQMAWTKMIIVVDDDVDVHDEQAVLRMMMQQCRFDRDVEIVNGPLDILDHAARELGAGCKIGFDATRTWPGESVNGVLWVAPTYADPQGGLAEYLISHLGIVDAAIPPWSAGRAAFISVDDDTQTAGLRAIERFFADITFRTGFVVVVDASVDVHDWQQVMFNLCANCDPGRDRHVDQSRTRLAFDATTKRVEDWHGSVRAFPPILEMDPTVRTRVDQNAAAYGLSHAESPDPL